MLYGIIAYLVISIIFLFLMSYKEKFKFYLCLKVLICLIILVLFNLILFIFFKEITMFAHLIFYIVGGTSLLFLNKKKYYSITALAILLLEIFAFNPLAYKDKEYQTSTINLNDITLLQNVELINEEYLTIKNDSRIKFNYQGKVKNVYFEFETIQNTNSYIDYLIKEDGGSLIEEYGKSFNSAYPKSCLIEFNKVQNANEIELRFFPFYTSPITFTIKKIHLNYAFKMNVEILRFLIFLIPSLLIVYAFTKKKIFETKEIKLKTRYVYGFLLILCLGIVFLNVKNPLLFYLDRAEVMLDNADCYGELFDALLKGQLYLDKIPDPRLAEVLNPYLPNGPGGRGGIPALWDRAYYNGKYYSYFGIAPVLVVYYPIYLLTGLIPKISLVYILGLIMFMPSVILVIIEGSKVFAKKVNKTLIIILSIAFILAGPIPLMITMINMYFMAFLYANLFLMLFLIFTFKAYSNQKKSLFLALAGLSLCLIIASRPITALYVLITLPLYIQVLFKDFKKSIIEFIPCLSIVLIGAILIGIYNYLRFDSFTQFGAIYQITVSDVSKNTIDLKKWSTAFEAFFIHTPKIDKQFPFIELRGFNYDLGYYVYSGASMGILFFPIIYLMISAFFVSFKKDNLKFHFTILLGIIVSLILGFISFCLAGIYYRYLLDILPILMVLSCISIIVLFSKVKYNFTKLVLLGVSVFLLIGGTILNANIMMTTENHTILNYGGIIFQYVSNFFR